MALLFTQAHSMVDTTEHGWRKERVVGGSNLMMIKSVSITMSSKCSRRQMEVEKEL